MPSRSRSSSAKRSRRPKGGARPALTSSPTSRGAYDETRQWLLAEHGPICAYCEKRVHAGAITLDHVTPRRGQTAYDRRDNLVLCCKACNTAKADKSILAFLLGNRNRALNLWKYGQHLSPMLLDMARGFVESAGLSVEVLKPAPAPKPRVRRKKAVDILGVPDEAPSPYQDDSPYSDQ